jgi:hypothetical protein
MGELMGTSANTRRYSVRKAVSPDGEANPTEPIAFGRGMVGSYSAHPAGLFVVFAVLLMALISLPEARWFLGCTVLLGGVWGIFLWLRHR